jgi:hypothetical protein
MSKRIIHLLLFVSFVIVSGASAEKKPFELKTQSKDKILSLADENPVLMDALMPEEKIGTQISLSSIPIPAINSAVNWIRKVVRSQWLPTEIEKKLVALKDAKQWEKKDKHGIVFSERKGDFFILEYELGGNNFHIQESGVSVSVRIDFASQDLTADPRSFISRSLNEFLNLPSGVSLDISVTNVPPLYKATVVDGVSPLEWWKSVEACTDGNFFFVAIREIDPANNRLQARPGLPDRF